MTTVGNQPQGGVEVEVIGDGRIRVEGEDSDDNDSNEETNSADSDGMSEYENETDGYSEYEDEKEKVVTSKKPPPHKMKGYATLYPRSNWGASPLRCPESIPRGKLPVTNLVITWTETEECSTEAECQKRVREIQEAHITFRRLPDIKYHYLVGGDGSLYEGRGWLWKGEDYPPSVGGQYTDTLNEQHMEVAIIGRSNKEPSKDQLNVLSSVVTLGQDEDWITTNFSVYWNTGQAVHFYKVYDATDELSPMLQSSS